MNDASTGESSKHKRAHGDEGEPEPGESGSTDASGQSGNDDVSEFSLVSLSPWIYWFGKILIHTYLRQRGSPTHVQKGKGRKSLLLSLLLLLLLLLLPQVLR